MASSTSDFLQSLLDMLASTELTSYYSRSALKSDATLLEMLSMSLVRIKALIDDAEEKAIASHPVKTWLDKVRSALYDVDDALDEIAFDAMQRKQEPQSEAISTSQMRKAMASKVGRLAGKVEDLVRQKDVLGLMEGRLEQGKSERLHTTYLIDESFIFGKDEATEILNMVISKDASDQIDVLSIVGMGGLGKTTLAQLVYNHEKVSSHFDLKAWISVGEEFDVRRLTKEILEQVTGQVCEISELNLLQLKLCERLAEKRFLLVLDDVWSENYEDWLLLRSPFQVGAKGSNIVVTTRSRNVAEIMSTMPPFYPEFLSDDDCWSIFSKHAFGYDSRSDPKVEEIGRRIVKRCKGLPLAAKTLGGLLRFKRPFKEWEAILKSDVWDILDMPFLPSLHLSYHHLPGHLKRCFAYCSLFPKGYEFEKEKLVLLWMAEGLLPRHGSKLIEEVDDSFNELLSRSFFLSSRTRPSRYVMHDLVSDLAHHVSGEFCFRLEDSNTSKMTKRIRHASYAAVNDDAFEEFRSIFQAEDLRSLLTFDSHGSRHAISKEALQYLLPKLPRLRVLSLPFYSSTEMPDIICNSRHLRYLDFSHTALQKLPDSISSLLYLETLILSNCHSLYILPNGLVKLTNLHHLDISGSNIQEMPLQMSTLKSLQTLTNFVVGNNGSKIIELSGLDNLRGALSISKLKNVKDKTDASAAKLEEMKYINELTLAWGSSIQVPNDVRHVPENDRQVLENLLPPRQLKKLIISSFLGESFPNWFGDSTLSNLVFLQLTDCFHCLNLPPLGQLPFLEDLLIEGFYGVKTVGSEFYGESFHSDKPFQSLKKLTFSRMIKWEEWSSFDEAEADEFHCLDELYIETCPKLQMNIARRFPSLKRLKISKCEQLAKSNPSLLASDLYEVWIDEKKGQPRSIDEDAITVISIRSDEAPSVSSSAPHSDQLALLRTATHGANEYVQATLSQDGEQQHTSPRSLKVSDVTLLRKFPTGLHSLRIEGCDTCETLPAEIMNSNPSLQELCITDCCSLKSFPVGDRPFVLKTLHIRNCRKLEFPLSPEMMHHYACLDHLCIRSSCDSLKSFPLNFFPKLRILCLWDCTNLESISICEKLHKQKDLKSLHVLEINDCPKLVSFPKEGLFAPNLTSIVFYNCMMLPSLPHQMHSLKSLESLYINKCPELKSLPTSGLPPSLNLLCITFCDKIIPRTDWQLDRLEALSHFEIEGGCEKIMSFPAEGLLPSTLNSLRISNLSNLILLDQNGLQQLTSLETLEINCCKRLRSLPEELPSSLSFLSIIECPLLKAKLHDKKGKGWSQIADIPNILIDQEEFH